MAKLQNYNYKGMVIAVGGPPHSGKSVFLAELYRQILARRPADVFLQRACPDGEGMWSAESDPTLVKEIRRKGNFDAGFMAFTLKAIEALGLRFPITLVDLGGRRSAQNAEILARSSHLIVLSSKEEENKPWQEFAAAEGCETLAVFASELVKLMGSEELDLGTHVRSEITASNAAIAGGTLRNLDRGKSGDSEERLAAIRECYREAVSRFADWLIARSDKESGR